MACIASEPLNTLKVYPSEVRCSTLWHKSQYNDLSNYQGKVHVQELQTGTVNTVNGKDSSSSHLVTIPAPCAHLADALLTSPVMAVSIFFPFGICLI